MNTKHTPTPWKVLSKLTAGKVAIVTTNEAPIQAVICIMDDRSKACDVVDREANANRIVLCCNMHDELVDALHRLTVVAERREAMLSDPVYVLDAKQDLQQAACEARAVLAKLEGGAL